MNHWFKNIHAYKLNKNITDAQLKNLKKFEPCRPHELESYGWSSILNNGMLFEKVSGAFMIQLQIDKKSVPASYVKKELKKRVAKLKEQDVGKIDKKALTEEIKQELAKNALEKTSFIKGYIDNKNGYLVIDSSSNSQIDIFVNELRKSLEMELDIDLLEPNFDASDVMTNWVADKSAPEPFELEDCCTLLDIGTGSTSSYKKQDLTSEEIDQNLSTGKRVSSLKFNWHERYTMTLTNDFKIKGIKESSIIGEQVAEDLGEDDSMETIFASSMTIMIEDFAELIGDLIKLGK